MLGSGIGALYSTSPVAWRVIYLFFFLQMMTIGLKILGNMLKGTKPVGSEHLITYTFYSVNFYSKLLGQIIAFDYFDYLITSDYLCLERKK